MQPLDESEKFIIIYYDLQLFRYKPRRWYMFSETKRQDIERRKILASETSTAKEKGKR